MLCTKFALSRDCVSAVLNPKYADQSHNRSMHSQDCEVACTYWGSQSHADTVRETRLLIHKNPQMLAVKVSWALWSYHINPTIQDVSI